MNPWTLHLCIFAVIYVIVTAAVFLRLLYLVVHHKINQVAPKWFATISLDSLSWPYYVLRYGIEGFWKEIK